MKFDFANVDSIEKAEAMEKNGELVKILLFPSEFGGDNQAHNSVYVPPEIAQAKQLITTTLIKFVEEKLIDSLTVTVDYKGSSVVPSVIHMTTGKSNESGSFNPNIIVW
jgi:hypothetical protein